MRHLRAALFELMVSADIFRGRYRESLEEPRPLVPGAVLGYEIPLPIANHTFRPGHRLMVQVQSTWFPPYDRNPQTFVSSIMTAPRSRTARSATACTTTGRTSRTSTSWSTPPAAGELVAEHELSHGGEGGGMTGR